MTGESAFWRHKLARRLDGETDKRRRCALQASVHLLDRADAAISCGEWTDYDILVTAEDTDVIAHIVPSVSRPR